MRHQVPIDLVTTSAKRARSRDKSGRGRLQVARVAHARGLSEDQVRQLIAENTRSRSIGIFGEPGVNVLLLNLALDRAARSPQCSRCWKSWRKRRDLNER